MPREALRELEVSEDLEEGHGPLPHGELPVAGDREEEKVTGEALSGLVVHVELRRGMGDRGR